MHFELGIATVGQLKNGFGTLVYKLGRNSLFSGRFGDARQTGSSEILPNISITLCPLHTGHMRSRSLELGRARVAIRLDEHILCSVLPRVRCGERSHSVRAIVPTCPVKSPQAQDHPVRSRAYGVIFVIDCQVNLILPLTSPEGSHIERCRSVISCLVFASHCSCAPQRSLRSDPDALRSLYCYSPRR
jgi:hypothetical protein